MTPETASHLLFSCEVAYRIWMICYNWFGLQVVLPCNTVCHFWQHFELIKKKKNLWMVIWLKVIWMIWTTRNKVFEETTIYYKNVLPLPLRDGSKEYLPSFKPFFLYYTSEPLMWIEVYS